MSNRSDLCLTAAALVVLAQGLPARAGAQPEGTENAASRSIDAKTAVRRVLDGNWTLRSATLELERARQAVKGEEDRYPFVFSADAGFTRSENPRLAPGDQVTSSTSRSYVVGTSLRRTFATGTTGEVRLQGDRFENESAQGFSGSTVGSGYGFSGRVAVTQPLLRGAGTRVGEAELRAARISRELSERAKRRVTSELIRSALSAYWELWYAGEAQSIERAALGLAKVQEGEARERARQGALAPADTLTFATRVAQLEESVVSAGLQREQRALELSRLMGSVDTAAAQWVATTAPTDATPTTRVQLEAALRAGSIELAEAESQARLARERAQVAGESNRARLDLEGYVQTDGVSTRIPKAVSRASQMGWVTAHVGLTFETPLGSARGDAERASALLAVRIAENNVRSTRDEIASSAAIAVANQSAARRRLDLARRTLDVALQAHAAEKARFELGQGLPISVQQAEDEVRRARLRVARAKVDAANAELAVQHLSGALLAEWIR